MELFLILGPLSIVLIIATAVIGLIIFEFQAWKRHLYSGWLDFISSHVFAVLVLWGLWHFVPWLFRTLFWLLGVKFNN